MRRHFLLLVFHISFCQLFSFFLILLTIKVRHFYLVILCFLIKSDQQFFSLLWTDLHEAVAVFFLTGFIEFIHTISKGFLITFFIAIIYHHRHKLAHLSSFCTRRVGLG